MVSGCGDSGASRTQQDLEQHFREEFGFNPPLEVKELRCSWVFVRDDLQKWISFEAPESLVRKLAEGGFTTVEVGLEGGLNKVPSPSDVSVSNPNAPSWWKAPMKNSVEQLYYKNRSTNSGTSYIYFWRDKSSGVIYAHSVIHN
jgi:hypothetical protein